MFDMQRIGRKIASLRKAHNMTQPELADKLNISFQAISNWERGMSMPDISKLPELADIFNISIDELLGEKSELLESVIDDSIEAYIADADIETIARAAEDVLCILKPKQVEQVIVTVKDKSPNDIKIFLPYMDPDDVAELAAEDMKEGNSIAVYLPFMDGEYIVKLAHEDMDAGKPVNMYLPFMDENDITELAKTEHERGKSIATYLPFMNEEEIAKLAQEDMEAGKSVNMYLPFMDENDIQDIVKKLRGKNK